MFKKQKLLFFSLFLTLCLGLFLSLFYTAIHRIFAHHNLSASEHICSNHLHDQDEDHTSCIICAQHPFLIDGEPEEAFALKFLRNSISPNEAFPSILFLQSFHYVDCRGPPSA